MGNMREKPIYDLWQFLRGEHYFYIDFLMSNIFASQEDLEKIYQYFKAHIHLCKLYIQKMLEHGISQWLAKESTMVENEEE
jgi:hypothetical protein